MSNWDLMMPGMGLTAIGLAGLTLSYAEIAHTFIDGMHALTGLTMFVGLIFLAAGILDGGVSTSNRAKATTLVILSISLGFGMYAMTMNTSNFTVTIAGILIAIAFPAIIISYLYMKHPTIAKPIGAIVSMAAATGIIMWVSFGVFSAPDTYMIPAQAGVEEPAEDLTPSDPAYRIEILEGSAIEGNPDYLPDRAVVPHGETVEWENVDSAAHTVTSTEGTGEIFDSGLLGAGGKYSLDTTDLEPREYEYFCIVHLWMVSTLVIEDAEQVAEPVTEPVTEPVAEQVMEPIAVASVATSFGLPGEQVAEQVMEPIAEQVVEPVVEPVAEQVAEQVMEPVAEQVTEPVAEQVTVSIPQGSWKAGCQETDECYIPYEITIDAGTVVSWSNDDTVAHTVTSGLDWEGVGDVFDSNLFPTNATFEVTFNDAGTFHYFCLVHPWMTGIVNVE